MIYILIAFGLLVLAIIAFGVWLLYADPINDPNDFTC